MTTAPLSACGRNLSVGRDVCVRGGVTGRRACVSPACPRSSPTMPPPLSEAGTRTAGRATWYVAALADRRHGIRLHTKTTLLHYYESDLCGRCVSAVIYIGALLYCLCGWFSCSAECYCLHIDLLVNNEYGNKRQVAHFFHSREIENALRESITGNPEIIINHKIFSYTIDAPARTIAMVTPLTLTLSLTLNHMFVILPSTHMKETCVCMSTNHAQMKRYRCPG